MQLSLGLLDVVAIEEVPPDLWKEVFDETGWPPSLAGKPAKLTHENIVTAFQHDTLPDHLLQALETLDALGSDAGREAIVAAMKDRGISLEALPKDTGVRELALRLFLLQQNDATMADVFARAQTQMQQDGDQRRYNEFMGKEPWPVETLKSKERTLQEEVLRYCRATDLGEHVEVRTFEDDGAYVFNIIRSHHTRKPLAVVPGHAARATIQYRPVHCDLVSYEASSGRLRIAARAATIVEFYRGVLGRVLFEDELFFSGDAVCNLRILQERGRAALDNHGVSGIGQIRMTECLWERGDRNLVQFRGSDCFQSIDELQWRFSEGSVLQAKLKIQVIGKSTRPVTVTVRVPSRIEITNKAHERLIETALKAIGIRNAVSTVAATDLWSLHPWRQPVAAWRKIFGSDMDSLVQQRVLVQMQFDAIPHADHPAAGRVLQVEPMQDGDFYAVSGMPEIPSRTVSATDLDGLELQPEQLRQYLRTILGITAGGTPWDRNELLDLGLIDVGGRQIHLAYALREPPSGVGARVRNWANGSPTAVLIPSGRANATELASVPLNTPIPKRADVVRSAVFACGLANLVPAVAVAPEGARLVVDNNLGKVWFDGVEILGLTPGTHPFRFIDQIARKLVVGEDLNEDLSSGRLDGNTTTRQAKTKANKLIKAAMDEAGLTFQDIFPSAGTGCYRCAVIPYVQ